MKKQEIIFHRSKKQQIDNLSKEKLPFWFGNNSNPIFIPKRKKHKK